MPSGGQRLELHGLRIAAKGSAHRPQLRIEAIESDIDIRPCCGLGYELVFVVPVLLAMRRWRRSAR